MALFNRKKKEPLTESGNVQNFEVSGIDSYHFIRGLRNIAADTYNTDYVLDRMMDDATISSAVDMYLDDSLQVDPQNKKIFWVEVDTTDDKFEKKLAEGITEELNRFLISDLRMDKELRQILRRTILYGSCPVRLDFIDKLEDDRLELIDKNKPTFEQIAVPVFDKLLESNETEDNTSAFTKLLEDNSDLYNLTEAADINIKDKVKSYLKESIKNNKTLKESAHIDLREDVLTATDNEEVRRLLRGRWCTEVIGSGTNIWELYAKGKTIAYMDVRKPNFFISPKAIVNFANNTGKYHINFEVGPYNESETNKDFFVLRRGQSYLDNAMVAWQILAALEDILILTRMTRSTLYRIFSVEVGNKGDSETKKILSALKNKIKSDETINVKEKIYNSEMRQIPLGDSIFIPTRNGIGNIDVKVVGGDINLRDAIDLDYFKDKLFSALRIPKAFLGFSEDTGGGLINTSLTRMDIRYARTIRGIQNIAADGLKDLCLKYLEFTRPESVLRELPDFKIVFTSVNTEEDNQRCETKQIQIETLEKILESLEGLGIEVSSTKPLRNELIKEWLGSNYLSIIEESEENGELSTNDEESEGEGELGGLGSGPSMSSAGGIDDFGPDTPFESEISDEESSDENIEEIGANDSDFEASDNLEAPSGLSRELS